MQFDFLWTSLGQGHGPRKLAALGCYLVTSASLAWSAYLHYHLWRELGYSHIPAIGTLFLLHAFVGALLAVVVALVHRVWSSLSAALFALLTLLSFLVAVHRGLFGFRESWAAPDARSAFVSESLVVIFALIAARLTLAQPRGQSHSRTHSRPRRTSGATGRH